LPIEEIVAPGNTGGDKLAGISRKYQMLNKYTLNSFSTILGGIA
jgi:hypothetical protein